ncbi:hypothetical protein [Massilia phosphatilytica]
MSLLHSVSTRPLASLPLIAAGAPVGSMFATAFVVDLRFVIFAALLFREAALFQRLF